jgi:GNAT superfamily N-acetyltransferase
VGCLIGGRRAVYSIYAPGCSAETTLALADDTLGWGGGTSSTGMTDALSTRAQVLAMLGERDGARATLTELETTFEGLDDRAHSPALGEWSWSETRLRHTRSFVCSYSGNVREAEAAQDAAIALYTTPSSLGLAQVRMHQAMSMITSGDTVQGARHLVGVLQSLDPPFRQGFVGSTATLALQALPERAIGIPEVRQARADGPGAIRVTGGLVVDHHGPGDFGAAEEFVTRLYVAAHADSLHDPFYSVERFVERVRGYARSAQFELVTGRIGDQPVGLALGYGLPEHARWWAGLTTPVDPELIAEDGTRTFGLCELMTDPDWQGRGVAHQIHDELLFNRPERRASLLVAAENETARQAYFKWGWHQIGKLRPYPDSPHYDALILDLDQSPA